MEYVHMMAPPPSVRRFGTETREIFSSLAGRATGGVIDRTGYPVLLDLIVDGTAQRFEFTTDNDLRVALERLTANCVPLTDHGELMRMLGTTIIGSLALLALVCIAARFA